MANVPSRYAAERIVVMSEVCVLVKPFWARTYGCAAEKTLKASPHVTNSISVQPAQDSIALLRFFSISLSLPLK